MKNIQYSCYVFHFIVVKWFCLNIPHPTFSGEKATLSHKWERDNPSLHLVHKLKCTPWSVVFIS